MVRTKDSKKNDGGMVIGTTVMDTLFLIEDDQCTDLNSIAPLFDFNLI